MSVSGAFAGHPPIDQTPSQTSDAVNYRKIIFLAFLLPESGLV